MIAVWEIVKPEEVKKGDYVKADTCTYSQKYQDCNQTSEGFVVKEGSQSDDIKILQKNQMVVNLSPFVGESGFTTIKKIVLPNLKTLFTREIGSTPKKRYYNSITHTDNPDMPNSNLLNKFLNENNDNSRSESRNGRETRSRSGSRNGRETRSRSGSRNGRETRSRSGSGSRNRSGSRSGGKKNKKTFKKKS